MSKTPDFVQMARKWGDALAKDFAIGWPGLTLKELADAFREAYELGQGDRQETWSAGYTDGQADEAEDAVKSIQKAYAEGFEAGRESAAKVCDDANDPSGYADMLADSIRRGIPPVQPGGGR